MQEIDLYIGRVDCLQHEFVVPQWRVQVGRHHIEEYHKRLTVAASEMLCEE